MLILIVFAGGSLVCCWIWGDLGINTKCLLTAIYAAIWGTLWVPSLGIYLFPAGQCLFAIVVGGMTFGVDWLTRDGWHVR